MNYDEHLAAFELFRIDSSQITGYSSIEASLDIKPLPDTGIDPWLAISVKIHPCRGESGNDVSPEWLVLWMKNRVLPPGQVEGIQMPL